MNNRKKTVNKTVNKTVSKTNRKNIKRNTAKSSGPLRIIPLGGVGEIGKNMYVIEYENDIIVIDCGLIFPEGDMLGIDYVIPDTTYLDKNKDKIRGIVLTHGHEDHIGATPYVLPKYDVPVFATRLTAALVEIKLSEHNISFDKFNIIEAGSKVKCGGFELEFLRVSHSIDDAVAVAVRTPEGVVIHTGDFKIDYTPIDGKMADLNRFMELGSAGVKVLLSDSTNADIPGYTLSEKHLSESFERYFSEAKGRIIVATFASNIHRLQQIIDVAKKFNRKIYLTGRSIVKITGVAKELGYLNLPDNMIIEQDELDRYKDNKIVVFSTGSQGEPMSGLVRMAKGAHPRITIKQGDLVILSASSIPGNEKNIANVMNLLFKQGARVINNDSGRVHVSGHALQEELKLMLAMTKPQVFIPIHGEERHLYEHANLAYDIGVKKKNVLIPKLGHSIEIKGNSASFGEEVESGIVMVDGLGVGDLGAQVLRDRQLLSQNGIFVVVLSLSKDHTELLSEPEILTRGFVYVKESEELIAEAGRIVIDAHLRCVKEKVFTYSAIKSKVKNALDTYLYKKTGRNPMILPIIIDV